MNEWFSVETIDGDTYAISEYGHFEEAHSYLLCGAERALLIDTGLGVADISAVTNRLTDLPITVFTTHFHWDHIGGHGHFSDIAVHEAEAEWAMHFPLPLAAVKNSLMQRPCDFPEDFSIEQYRIFQGQPSRILRDGDTIDLGGRQVAMVHTPGHSPGHCCFYESERGYLYSGDMIYMGCLYAFYPSTDPFQFWSSVRRLQGLRVSRILPGHHRLDVPLDMIDKVEVAFSSIHEAGGLRQGRGVFDFEDFQIHI